MKQNSTWTRLMALLLLVGTFTFTSCDENMYDDFEDVEVDTLSPIPDHNLKIADLVAMYEPGGNLVEFHKELVIHGRVITDDFDGNFYNEMFIQDETGGIKVSLSLNSIYATYPPGSLVAVKVNGLKLGAYGNLVSLGVDTDRKTSSGNAYENDRIPRVLIDKYIYGPAEIKPIEPREVTMDEIKDLPDGILIRMNDVQFIESELDQTWANATDPNNKRAEDRHIEQKGHKGRLVVRSSGYARFANDRLPQGSGYIIGVLTRFRDTRQLVINSPSEFQMIADRFESGAITPPSELPEANTTIAKVRAMCPSTGSKAITEDLVISGTIISDDSDDQFFKNIYVQDKDGYGLNIQVDMKKVYQTYPFGSEVVVRLKGLHVASYEGSIRVGVEDSQYGAGRIPEDYVSSYILLKGKGTISPKEIKLEDAKPEMGGTYVRITGLTPEKPGSVWNDGKYNTANVYFKDDKGNKLVARVSKYASFAEKEIPAGPLSITGVLDYHKGSPQITFASIDDVKE